MELYVIMEKLKSRLFTEFRTFGVQEWADNASEEQIKTLIGTVLYLDKLLTQEEDVEGQAKFLYDLSVVAISKLILKYNERVLVE